MEKDNNKTGFRKTLEGLKIKIIDMYIIRKFLGTFFFSLVAILTIAVVFDFAEKVDNFMQNHAPVKAIIFNYYFNFIPYFATLFSPPRRWGGSNGARVARGRRGGQARSRGRPTWQPPTPGAASSTDRAPERVRATDRPV